MTNDQQAEKLEAMAAELRGDFAIELLSFAKALEAIAAEKRKAADVQLAAQKQEGGNAVVYAVARVYGCGYAAGHNDTVESIYQDVHYSERQTVFEDVAKELLSDSDYAILSAAKNTSCEAVGEIVSMFEPVCSTVALFNSDLPIGTKLYADQRNAEGKDERCERCDKILEKLEAKSHEQ